MILDKRKFLINRWCGLFKTTLKFYGYGKIPYFNYITTVGPNGTIYFGVLWGPVTDITFGNPNIANVTPQQVTVEVIWRY